MNVFVCLDDKKRYVEQGGKKVPEFYPKTFYTEDKQEFTRLNSLGYGIYKAVNSFDCTEDELKTSGKNTKRQIEFLKKLNRVFADLDVAKSGDGQTQEQIDKKKQVLLEAMLDYCPPTKVINTRNGLQPLRKIEEENIDKETQSRYVSIINGIIERSTKHGAMGDHVKDVTRIIRLPGYNHMKADPYLVTIDDIQDVSYTLDDLSKKFYVEEPKKQATQKQYTSSTPSQFREIEKLDIQEVVIRAFRSIGRSAEFDKEKRLILDGRVTGTHQGKIGDGQFIASNSHEPFQGNKISVVADILCVSKKEAYKRILDEFNIPVETELKKIEKVVEKERQIEEELDKNFRHISTKEKIELGITELVSRDPTKIIKRGRAEFDNLMGGIYPGRIYLVGADTGVGKSSFVSAVCQNIASAGNKVVKYSLEDRMEDKAIEDLYQCVNRIRIKEGKQKYDPIKFQNNEYNDVEFLQYLMEAKKELTKVNIVELEKNKPVNIEIMSKLIESEAKKGVKVFCIDHLHMFDFGGSDMMRQDLLIEGVMLQLNDIVRKYNISILLVAQYKANIDPSKGFPRNDWFRGASSIKQTVNCIIHIVKEENIPGERRFYVTKLRGLFGDDAEFQFTSFYNIFTGSFDFRKTEEQEKKEKKHFSSMLV